VSFNNFWGVGGIEFPVTLYHNLLSVPEEEEIYLMNISDYIFYLDVSCAILTIRVYTEWNKTKLWARKATSKTVCYCSLVRVGWLSFHLVSGCHLQAIITTSDATYKAISIILCESPSSGLCIGTSLKKWVKFMDILNQERRPKTDNKSKTLPLNHSQATCCLFD
jgi:hypothetical protein